MKVEIGVFISQLGLYQSIRRVIWGELRTPKSLFEKREERSQGDECPWGRKRKKETKNSKKAGQVRAF